MMACITDEDEPTLVTHRAYLALHVNDEAERHTGDEARELFEDAQRLARSISWGFRVSAEGAR